LGFLDGFLDLIPHAAVAHIGLARNEKTLQPESYYLKHPADLADADLILLDPMLATGGTVAGTIRLVEQLGAQVVVEQWQVDLYGGALALRAGDNGVQGRADLDPRLLTGNDRAVDKEGDVRPDNFRNVETQRAAARANRAAHADGAAVMGFVLAVEVPQAKRKDGGVLRRQGQHVFEEGVGAILVEKRGQRRIARILLPCRERADRGEEIIPGKGEVV
jgi:adenine/guanine phosphoribosyltransferase-like PRPP-binding protein